MKRIIKIIFLLSVTSLLIIELINFLSNQKQVKAASKSGTTSDVQLLARAINGEARGEPYEGQVAVGAVILNRVASSKFPNTISGVIYQPGAFTAVSDGQINVPIAASSSVIKGEQYIISIQLQQQINGYGQGHL